MIRFKPTIVARFALLAAGIAAIASLLIGSFIINNAVDIVYGEELKYLSFVVDARSQAFLLKIDSLSADLKYLAGTPPVKGIPRALQNQGIDPLDNSSVQLWKNRLSIIFSELIRAKPMYQQARYIGVADNGREIVRVDRLSGDITRRTEDELQKKGNRAYFQAGSRLAPGKIYLSEINLNREAGRFSLPYTPVLRALTPVYYDGRLFGMMVINMDMTRVFRDIIETKPRGTTAYVTNEQGYFLAHSDSNVTFGFERDRQQDRIQDYYPQLELAGARHGNDREFTLATDKDVVQVSKAFFDPMNGQRFVAIVLAASHENLIAQSRGIRNASIQIMLILVFVSMLVAALMARLLLRPLKLITRASGDLVHGNSVDYLPVQHNDEIGELARSFDHMYHQLEEKKKELLESQARSHHVNKLASLGEMASGMAHEINSPIQTIQLIAQRIMRRIDKLSASDICRDMEKISLNIGKVSAIIEGLRKVSRSSTDEDFSLVSIGEVVDDAVQMTAERFRVNGVNFAIQFVELTRDELIQCKRIQIAQILINLLNNAFDAVMQLQEKWIRMEVAVRDDNIVFSLVDSGEGISAALQERLFEPLFTTKEIGKGTGLGLSISREIAQNHHGELYYEAESGHTRFVLTLPRRQRNLNP